MQGYVSLILHAHLPFVRHPEHDRFLEENWLFEAITETYIPLLQTLKGWHRDGMQTPITLANKRDRAGKAQLYAVRLAIAKELPASFRLPGKQPLTEQVFYHLLFNFLTALNKTGVAVCGSGSVQPLAGRTETVGPRN